MSDCIFILFHFIGLTIFCFCHLSLFVFDRYSYSFQHSNYISCQSVNKPNDSSKGEFTTEVVTSVTLKDLLPYSMYIVEVAANTVEYGGAESVTGRTLELGKLF
jgi:hypothetical protein